MRQKFGFKDCFNSDKLDDSYEYLVDSELEKWAGTSRRQGYLRMQIKSQKTRTNNKRCIAKLVGSNHVTISTHIEFTPQSLQQIAGLTIYNDKGKSYLFYVRGSKQKGEKQLQISYQEDEEITELVSVPIVLTDIESIGLKISLEEEKILFYYSPIRYRWYKTEPSLNTNILYTDKEKTLAHTFAGMFVASKGISNLIADYEYFKYEEF